jgi:hypothetical protein
MVRTCVLEFLENLVNDTFNEVYVVDEKKTEEKVSMDKSIPKPMSKNEKEKIL